MRDGAGQLACLQGLGKWVWGPHRGMRGVPGGRRCGQRERGRAAAETSGGSWRVLLELKRRTERLAGVFGANQAEELSPEYSLDRWMLNWRSNTLAT